MLHLNNGNKDISSFILQQFSENKLDLAAQCSQLGNTALHYACILGDKALVSNIYNKRPKLALKANF